MWRVGGTGFDETAVFMKKLCGDRCDKSRRKVGGKEGREGFRTFVRDGGRTGDERVDCAIWPRNFTGKH
jgi:hypothetical protein